MKPVDFPNMNITLAGDQPEYITLPAFVDRQQAITCWRLSWREAIKLLFTRRLWLRQLTFGDLLQPQLPQVETPWDE